MPLLQGGAILSVADWQWLEVTSGIAPVTAPLVDALVPQMLNYESVGGVNFKKGCYPGQEVVARSQYRGTLKRRTHRVNSTQPLEVGQAVFHPSDAEQPCGLVVAAASSPSGTHGGLVAFQLSALDGQMLQVPAAQATLSVLPLPYALRDDI
jgi:folate-binding protein YgfZ